MRVYFPAGPLSAAELHAARLDGELVPLGLGWVPAGAIPTPALRAASLAPLIGTGLAAVGLTAAWVHGAAEHLPHPCHAQRATISGARPVGTRLLRVRDALLPAEDQEMRGGVRVSTPARVLVDLVADDAVAEPLRARCEAIDRLAARQDVLAGAIALARRRARMPRRPEVLTRLEARRAAQEDVTR